MRRSGSVLRLVAALLIAGFLLPAQAPAQAPAEAPAPAPDDAGQQKVDWSGAGQRVGYGAAVGFDAVIVRPLYACATVIGAILFVPAFLLSAAGGSEARSEAYELFIEIPSQGVYQRPLGEF